MANHDHPFLNLDQRLLVLGTRHDQVVSSPADVVCNLDNAGTGFKSKVIGVSLETAGFNHFMRNVPPKLTRLSFTVYNSDLFPDGTELKVEIPPNQYDSISFAAALQAGFDTAFGAPGVITIAVNNPPGLPQSISYQLNAPFAAGGFGYITMVRSKNLARVMGVNRNELFVVIQASAVMKMPLLSGEPCIYIHSKALTGSRSSLGGHQANTHTHTYATHTHTHTHIGVGLGDWDYSDYCGVRTRAVGTFRRCGATNGRVWTANAGANGEHRPVVPRRRPRCY